MTLEISLKETTQGSSDKVFKYELKRIKLDKPIILKRGDAKIKIEYKTELKANKEVKSI